jgi:bifunctional non-homologous end joining protein LigD
MLATLTDERFSDPDWIYERKFDGERFLIFKEDTRLRLVTRNGNVRNEAYPELVDALGRLGGPSYIADGEIVAFEGGVTSFARLQHRMHVTDENEARRLSRRIAVHLYLFDLPWADGYDLTQVPLRARKGLLRSLLEFGGRVRYTQHRNEEGKAYFAEACKRGWEGLIAKRAASHYQHRRSDDWLKFKCRHEQELVVGGFTDPGGSRVGFGALLVGYYDEGELVYAGKVGTGWDDEALEDLRARMDGLETDRTLFDREAPDSEGIHWIEPRLVVEVGFTEWTRAGKLRHPHFLGMRDDKDPEDVVREESSQ